MSDLYQKDIVVFVAQLYEQGWIPTEDELFNSDGEVYSDQEDNPVVSFQPPSKQYYLNIWLNYNALYVMSGDAKLILGDDDLLLGFRPSKLLIKNSTFTGIEQFFAECKGKNVEEVISGLVVANHL